MVGRGLIQVVVIAKCTTSSINGSSFNAKGLMILCRRESPAVSLAGLSAHSRAPHLENTVLLKVTKNGDDRRGTCVFVCGLHVLCARRNVCMRACVRVCVCFFWGGLGNSQAKL